VAEVNLTAFELNFLQISSTLFSSFPLWLQVLTLRKSVGTLACLPTDSDTLSDKTLPQLRSIAFKTVALVGNWTAPIARLKSSKMIRLGAPREAWVDYLLPGINILVLCEWSARGMSLCTVTCWDLLTSSAIGSFQVSGYQKKSNLSSGPHGTYVWAFLAGGEGWGGVPSRYVLLEYSGVVIP
jgi:type IV secretory pathway TrbD component